MVGNRRLGRTDVEVTPIGLGCAQMAVTGMTSRVCPTREANAVVQAALDGGITWFDAAEGYGRGGSERALTTARAPRVYGHPGHRPRTRHHLIAA